MKRREIGTDNKGGRRVLKITSSERESGQEGERKGECQSS